jgi:hypothetical protein
MVPLGVKDDPIGGNEIPVDLALPLLFSFNNPLSADEEGCNNRPSCPGPGRSPAR